MCGFSCARKDYLSHHYKTVHEDQETFQCAECGKTFKQRHSLKKHIISNHENENIKKRFDCPFCPGKVIFSHLNSETVYFFNPPNYPKAER